MSTSEAIIAFIADLPGMAPVRRIDINDEKFGALDVLSGQTFEPATKFPEGEMLLASRQDDRSGLMVLVHSRVVVDAVLVRAAHALAITQDGRAQNIYLHLKNMLRKETGFSY